MRLSSPFLQCLVPKNHLSKFTPRLTQIQGIFQVELSFQIGEALTGPVSGYLQPLHQKVPVSCDVFVLHGYDWIHGWPSPAPRLHVDDCTEIHILR